MSILLTKSTMPIIKWFADILGLLMNAIYSLGVTNIGLCIILFTLVIYTLMTPLQIKQQKFSRLNAVMAPELQKIQKKYQNKKDQVSMQKMQEETSMVYQKYGVSPTGSCLQLVIQMPILFALYQVIYKIPGYVTGIKATFDGVITQIMGVGGYTDILQTFLDDQKIKTVRLILDNGKATKDSIIDLLYNLSPTQWDKLSEIGKFSGFSDTIASTADKLSPMQNFLGLNIADNPLSVIKSSFVSHQYILLVGAILIPVLAWLTQVLNIKLSMAFNNSNKGDDKNKQSTQMEATMKSMNTFMPLFSAVMCFTFPVGIGIYWIAGAVIRSVQQFVINKLLEKEDMDELVKKNLEKMNKKREKAGLPPQKISQQARMNVRNIDEPKTKGKTPEDREQAVKNSTDYYKRAANAKPGSIAAKANMVAQFDEKNKSKNKKQ